MNQRFIAHAFLIVASSLLPFVWSEFPTTSPYTLQLCGALTILYIGLKKFLPVFAHNFDPNILTILTANSITQLLIFSTGGASSPLFFLYYFLIFAFATIYESYQAITVALITVIIFIIKSNPVFDPATIIHLFSLLLISPLAQIFSSTRLNNLESQGKISLLNEDLKKEETDSLLWLSTEAKPTLNSVIDSVTDLIIFLKSSRHNLQVPSSFLNKIKSIQSDLLALYASGEDLEDSIIKSSDSKEN